MIAQDAGPGSGDHPSRAVFYTLDGAEHVSPVPPGLDRWDAVAEALALRLRREVRVEDPPFYDTGTRSWTLPVQVCGRWGRRNVLAVPVRW